MTLILPICEKETVPMTVREFGLHRNYRYCLEIFFRFSAPWINCTNLNLYILLFPHLVVMVMWEYWKSSDWTSLAAAVPCVTVSWDRSKDLWCDCVECDVQCPFPQLLSVYHPQKWISGDTQELLMPSGTGEKLRTTTGFVLGNSWPKPSQSWQIFRLSSCMLILLGNRVSFFIVLKPDLNFWSFFCAVILIKEESLLARYVCLPYLQVFLWTDGFYLPSIPSMLSPVCLNFVYLVESMSSVLIQNHFRFIHPLHLTLQSHVDGLQIFLLK